MSENQTPQVETVVSTPVVTQTETPKVDVTALVTEVSGEAPVAEAPKVEPVVEAPKVDKLAAKLAKQKEKETKLTEREKTLAEREKKIVDKETFLTSFRAKPIQTLRDSGISLKELADLIVKDEGDGVKQDPLEKVTKTVEELEAKLTKKEQEEAERQRKADDERIDAAINAYKSRVLEFVDTHKDKYELISTLGEQEAVFSVVEEYHQRTNKVLTPEEAADMVEAYLERRVDSLAATTKFKTKYQNGTQKEQKPTTLTNGLSNFAAPGQPIPAHLSKEERLAAASKLLRFTE